MSEMFAGAVNAPNFPPGLAWLNTEQPLDLRNLRGKIVLLDFWTYCCINCLHVVAQLRDLEEKYREVLVVIGVHSAKFRAEGSTDAIREAILRYDIRHPVVNDREFKLWDAYAVRLWPTLMIIDPRGKVIARHEGEVSVETFDDTLNKLVADFDSQGLLNHQPLSWRLEQDQLKRDLAFPGKVLADETGGRLFVADTNHHRIIVSDLDGQVQRVIGTGEAGLSDEPPRFNAPQGLALSGEMLYVADTGNHALRRIDLTSGGVETVAGNGQQATSYYQPGQPLRELNSPWDCAALDGKIYLAMAGFHQVWCYDPADRTLEIWAGAGPEGLVDGSLNEALLAQPSGIAPGEDRLWLACSEASAIRQCDLASRRVSTLVGMGLYDFGDVDGSGDTARLQHPLGICAGPDGLLYIADSYNHKIKRLNPITQ